MINFELLNLSTQCRSCTACRLHETRTQTVFGSGRADAPILVMGEAPGEEEDKSGLPFVGRSGKLLTDLFDRVGIDRGTQLYVTNTVKCRPPNNRDPEPDEKAACRHFLEDQLRILQPRIIVLVGRIAAASYLGREVKITQERGQWLPRDPQNPNAPWVMPIYHPSFLLRNPSEVEGSARWLTLQDLAEVARVFKTFGSSGSSGSPNTTPMGTPQPATDSFWSDLGSL